ncbi:MAG: M15 family metallopeptidase [Bacteroidota bacterium]|nr:M15 family metallopeptidase [Bacteroidota bacterium]
MNRIYKIKYCIKIAVIVFFINFTGFNIVSAQSKIGNKYGLHIINNTKILQKEIEEDPANDMVNLQNFIPSIKLDLKYATIQNFMHQKLYPPIKTTFLRKPAAVNLKKVVEELKKQNLSVKIFDAYRPYSITEKMWEKVKDDRYAADPAKGSGHNRGAAVDLTLIDLKTGKELPMGTGFDNFSDTAHPDFTGLQAEVLKHRNLLKRVMEENGFKQLSTEWWHFYLPNSSSFELLDISFGELKKMDKRN